MESTAIFTITTTNNDKLFKLSSFFNGDELENQFNLNTWCYKFEYENYILVIPCEEIFAITYDPYPNIKESLFKGYINDLYYKVIESDKTTITINCTYKIQQNEISILARLLTDKDLLNKFTYHFLLRAIGHYNNDTPYFKTYFLHIGTFQIITSLSPISKKHLDKSLYLVKTIDKLIAPHPFEKIRYKKLKPKENVLSKHDNYNEIVIKKNSKKISNALNNFNELIFNATKYNIDILGTFYDKNYLDSDFIVTTILIEKKYFHVIVNDYPTLEHNILVLKDNNLDKYSMYKNYYKTFYKRDYHPILSLYNSNSSSFGELTSIIKRNYNYDLQRYYISSDYLTSENKILWAKKFISDLTLT